MKIIHTYLKTEKGSKLDKLHMYSMCLSLYLAKRHYEKVVLYTDIETAELVKRFGLPYDEINTQLLDGVEVRTFSIPKLMVYSAQTEPYIHIDLDSFIYEKIHFDDEEVIYSTYPEGSEHGVDFGKNARSFYNTYISSSFEIQDKLDEEFLKEVNFTRVPNMSLFGGYQYEIISKASKYCLELYEKNKDFFDLSYYNACIIEQLFIPAAVKLLKEEEGDIFKYLFKHNPTFLNFYGNKWEIPFSVETMNVTLNINTEKDLFKHIMYDFNGFLHLNGYKGYDRLLFLIKQRVLQDFEAYEQIRKIDYYFKDDTTCNDMCNNYIEYLNNSVKRLKNI